MVCIIIEMSSFYVVPEIIVTKKNAKYLSTGINTMTDKNKKNKSSISHSVFSEASYYPGNIFSINWVGKKYF